MQENRWDPIERLRALTPEKWVFWQRALGVFLGLAAGACLFLIPDSGGIVPLNFISAFVVAFVAPRYLERRTERAFDQGRIALLISIAVSLAAFLLYLWLTGGFTRP